MAKVTAMQAKSKPTFSPNQNYKWEPDDVFEITGLQLASLFHCINRQFNDWVPPSVVADAFSAIIDVMKRGVEQGVIVPVTDEVAEQIEEVEQNVNKLFENKAPFGQGKNPDELPHWHPNS